MITLSDVGIYFEQNIGLLSTDYRLNFNDFKIKNIEICYYLAGRRDSLDHAHVNENPSDDQRQCNLPVEYFWCIDVF